MYMYVYTYIFKIAILYRRKDKVQYYVIHEIIKKTFTF